MKIAINGFGRIGRLAFRQVFDDNGIEIAAINDLTSPEMLAYLLKYDSVQGQFKNHEVTSDDTAIIVDGVRVPVYSEADASKLPWGELGIDIVLECTGFFTSKAKSQAHIDAGAKKVLISAPAGDDLPTIVYGVNHENYHSDMKVVSNASCTTNCLAPLMKVIEDHYGIKEGLMSTIHAATAKQKVVDAKSLKDWRTGRSVFGNVIPSTTGAAKAVGLVIPSLQGKMTGISYRVPTADVSVIDVNVVLNTPTSGPELRQKIKEASETYLKGVLEYVDDEVVSGDFVGDSHTSIFDSRQTIELNDHFFKLIAYYDNEFGYSSNLLNMLKYMHQIDCE